MRGRGLTRLSGGRAGGFAVRLYRPSRVERIAASGTNPCSENPKFCPIGRGVCQRKLLNPQVEEISHILALEVLKDGKAWGN